MGGDPASKAEAGLHPLASLYVGWPMAWGALHGAYPLLHPRAGNILLNVLVPPNMPCSRTGKNNVLIVCVPNPPISERNATVPVTMLIRVKTTEDADELHKILLEKKEA